MDETLESARLVLRPLDPEDAVHFVRLLAGDGEAVRQMALMSCPLTPGQARAWIESRTAAGERTFAVTRRLDGAFIGAIGIRGPTAAPDLGFWIGGPFRRRGYATEAVRLVIALVRDLGALRIKAETWRDNLVSNRMLGKAGFGTQAAVAGDGPAPGRGAEVCRHTLALR
ncbi:MAG: GNAT family N-acetyltransferase [Pseudomonadota bacterium]